MSRINRTIIVCGGRDYSDTLKFNEYMSRLTKPFTIVTGGASGADEMAVVWAKANKVPCLVVSAEWEKHGKAAGPIRNSKMLTVMGKIDAVIAFPGGRGTENMIEQALKAGVGVFKVGW